LRTCAGVSKFVSKFGAKTEVDPCNRLKGLVAGEGFEPSTFGL
jgi:hypothetical protein